MNRLKRARNNGGMVGSCGGRLAAVVTGAAPINVTRDRCSNFLVSVNKSFFLEPPLFFGSDTVGMAPVESGAKTLELDAEMINTDAAYANVNGEITVPSAGYYDVAYHCQFQSDNNCCGPYSSISAWVEVDSNDGTGFVYVVGSASSCHIVEAAGPIICPGTGKSVVIYLGEHAVLRVVYAKMSGTTTACTRPGESSINVKKL